MLDTTTEIRVMEMAQEVDNMLISLARKYDKTPLVCSAVVLSRLMVFNTEKQQSFKTFLTDYSQMANKIEPMQVGSRVIH